VKAAVWASARLTIASCVRALPTFLGLNRLIRALDYTFLGLSRDPLVGEIEGVHWALDTEDLIDFRILYFGGHDRHIVDYIARVAPKGGVVWDVGANVGAICLPVAAKRPDLFIHAYEPSPAVFARLQRNLALNVDLASRISAHCVALTDRSGTVEFFASNERENSGVGSLGRMENTVSVAVNVRALTASEVVEADAASAPSLVKVDVEGFEMEFVRGLERMRPLPPVILLEQEPYRLRERGISPSALPDALRSLGYRIDLLSGSGEILELPNDLGGLRGDLVAQRA
jgi:FkbM family methyltransferase